MNRTDMRRYLQSTSDRCEPARPDEAPRQYRVAYHYDDRMATQGTCTTDHCLYPGETFYAQHGRAIVESCTPIRSEA